MVYKLGGIFCACVCRSPQIQLVCDSDTETPISMLNSKFQEGIADQLGFVTAAGHAGIATVALSMLSLPTEKVIKFSRVSTASNSLAMSCPVNFKSPNSGRGIKIKEFQAMGRDQETYSACGFDFIDKACTDIGELCGQPPGMRLPKVVLSLCTERVRAKKNFNWMINDKQVARMASFARLSRHKMQTQ